MATVAEFTPVGSSVVVGLPMSLESDLKDAVRGRLGEETRYAVAKGSGVPYRTLTRWLDEDGDIRLQTASKIADYLGLKIGSPGRGSRRE